MMRALLAVAFVATLAAPASAETLDGARIVVIDGDTVALPCAAPAPGCAERLRLPAIDAPELAHARCEAETVIALAAKERLRDLLRGPVAVRRGDPATGLTQDRYGRTLGTLERLAAEPGRPAGDVQGEMLRLGLALPYAPGAQAWETRRAYWCGRR